MILLPEKIFQLIGVFLYGYSFGYYIIEYLRYKNKKEEIEKFLSNYNKYYGSKYRGAFRRDEEMNLTNEMFYREDLCSEENFLKSLTFLKS